MVRRLSRFLAILALTGLAAGACSLRPFPTTPPEALRKALEDSPAASISVCYSKATTTPEEIIKAVTKSCAGPDARLVFHGQDGVPNDCPLLQPARATFLCVEEESRVDYNAPTR